MKNMQKFKTETIQHFFGNNSTHFFPIRTCVICEQSIGYCFMHGNVYFNSNCGCTSIETQPDKRLWSEFTGNFNSKPDLVKEMFIIQNGYKVQQFIDFELQPQESITNKMPLEHWLILVFGLDYMRNNPYITLSDMADMRQYLVAVMESDESDDARHYWQMCDDDRELYANLHSNLHNHNINILLYRTLIGIIVKSLVMLYAIHGDIDMSFLNYMLPVEDKFKDITDQELCDEIIKRKLF